MKEQTSYEIFVNELASLEKQIYAYVKRSEEVFEENKKLKEKIDELESENEILKIKIEEFQKRSKEDSGSGIDNREREKIKRRIDELIEKIDFHMRS